MRTHVVLTTNIAQLYSLAQFEQIASVNLTRGQIKTGEGFSITRGCCLVVTSQLFYTVSDLIEVIHESGFILVDA